MSQIYRVEALTRERCNSSQTLPRLVVIVEIPDHVFFALGDVPADELELKAVGIAMDSTWAKRVKHRNLQFLSWSGTLAMDANPADYGAANFRSSDGCRAWILGSPFAEREPDLSREFHTGAAAI